MIGIDLIGAIETMADASVICISGFIMIVFSYKFCRIVLNKADRWV